MTNHHGLPRIFDSSSISYLVFLQRSTILHYIHTFIDSMSCSLNKQLFNASKGGKLKDVKRLVQDEGVWDEDG
jgi:hypothetical protein